MVSLPADGGKSPAIGQDSERHASDAADVFAPALPPGILTSLFSGEALTPEESEAWEAYQRAHEDAHRRRDLLGLVDLAEVMRNGVTAPEMLDPEDPGCLLVKGEHHVVYGAKESMKTWHLLMAAARQIAQGHDVVWVDKEMGSRNMADRLLTLGTPPAAVEKHFSYLEFPVLDGAEESRALFAALLDARRPALMVVDAHTEVLADAALNENSGTDVARWEGWYLAPARRLGVATVMIDHVSFADGNKPVASRQKGAAAKVELRVTRKDKIDRDTAGMVEVVVTKNTVAAPIDEVQLFRMGGDGEGGFVYERMGPLEAALAAGPGGDPDLDMKIEKAVREHGPLSQNNLTRIVDANKAAVMKAAKRLAASLASNVENTIEDSRYGPTIMYSWVVPEVVPDEAAGTTAGN